MNHPLSDSIFSPRCGPARISCALITGCLGTGHHQHDRKTITLGLSWPSHQVSLLRIPLPPRRGADFRLAKSKFFLPLKDPSSASLRVKLESSWSPATNSSPLDSIHQTEAKYRALPPFYSAPSSIHAAALDVKDLMRLAPEWACCRVSASTLTAQGADDSNDECNPSDSIGFRPDQ
jgi:hypothetical protein